MVCLEIVLISAQHRYTYVLNVALAWKSFWAHLIIIIANAGQEEARFDPFGYSVNLVAR